MKKLQLLIYISIISLISCNIESDINSSINIQLNTTRATLDITSISLTVEASDMDTVEAYSEDSNSISVEIEEGNDRTFSINVTLDSGDTMSGSTTEDISSSTSSVSIDVEYDTSAVVDLTIDTGDDYTISFNVTELTIGSDSTGDFSVTVNTGSIDSWSHYIDGAESISNENAVTSLAYTDDTTSYYYITIDGTAYAVGSHELTVIADIDGVYYSESLYFEVTN